MFQMLRAAWDAGLAGQPLPARVDKSTGQTVAMAGIFGIAVITLFGTAYAIGTSQKWSREKDDRIDSGDDLKNLEADAKAAKLELGDVEDKIVEDGEEEYLAPPGSAACPVCHSVHLDSDHAADCCSDKRGWEENDDGYCHLEQDPETGEITSPDEEDEEDEGVDDLWSIHLKA